jgi:hypothetical protein
MEMVLRYGAFVNPLTIHAEDKKIIAADLQKAHSG